MSRSLIVVSEAFRLDGVGAAALAGEGFHLQDRRDLVHRASPEQLIAALEGAWGVVAGSERYTAEVISGSTTLRVIARPGVGVDAIDVGAASIHGVAVLITPGANDESVADLTLALMLGALRRLLELDGRTRSGAWRPSWAGRDLYRATVVIVGLGAIGRAVARRLVAFECRILAVDPAPDLAFCERFGIELARLEEALPACDVLTIHAPLLAETRGLIGGKELSLLPQHALVVNVARGGIVDEEALVTALEQGRIGAAALDVFEHEPLGAGHRLAALPNVLMTPHHAAFTLEAIDRMARATADNLLRVAHGEIPPACINGDAPRVRALVGERV